jgi:hypothetical protein
MLQITMGDDGKKWKRNREENCAIFLVSRGNDNKRKVLPALHCLNFLAGTA